MAEHSLDANEYPVNIEVPEKVYTKNQALALINIGLPFPYYSYHLKKDMEKYKTNIAKYEPTWITYEPKPPKNIINPYKLYFPSGFRDMNMMLILHKTYRKIDEFIDLFNEDQRMKAKKVYYKNSLIETWNDKDELVRIIQKTVSTYGKIDSQSLRNTLYNFGAPGNTFYKEVSLYSLSKCLALNRMVMADLQYGENPKALEGKSWLDISSGWGDRLAAACVLGMDYLAFDPNFELKRGHDAIIEELSYTGKQEIVYSPFEQSEIIIQKYVKKYGGFDLVHSSPPFFNIEIYNSGDQSINNFASLDAWVVNFLFRSLSIVWSALKNEGHMIINMYDAGKDSIIVPMLLFVEKYLPGSSWEGTIPFSGTKKLRVDSFQYVFVWKKTTGRRNIWNPSVVRNPAKLFPNLFG